MGIYIFIGMRKKEICWICKKELDESGIEPETYRMRSERATNCATRPKLK